MFEDTMSGAIAESAVPDQPQQLPVEIQQVPKPAPAPYRQVDCERVLDVSGEVIGLNVCPKPGNAIVRVELRDLRNGRWKVSMFTEPRRGRAHKSTKRKE